MKDETTWTDLETGLNWQVEPAPERMSWAAAKKYAANLDLNGGGWQLPAKDELVGISGRNRPGELTRWSGCTASPLDEAGGEG